MKKNHLIFIGAIIFLLGDLEASIRLRRRISKFTKMNSEKISLAQMKIDALLELVNVYTSTDNYSVLSEATDRFNETAEFINLIEENLNID